MKKNWTFCQVGVIPKERLGTFLHDTTQFIPGDHHSNTSGVKSDDQHVILRRRPKKSHVHRSRSDLTKRFSNSSDLSELSARISRNSADLEKFFNEMGLDRAVLEPMLSAQCNYSSSNLHLYESASSIDSPDARSWCSGMALFFGQKYF